MPSFLNLHAIARPGDGLRPELRALFERLATARHCDVTARGDRMVQSEPNKTFGREPGATSGIAQFNTAARNQHTKRKLPLNLLGSK